MRVRQQGTGIYNGTRQWLDLALDHGDLGINGTTSARGHSRHGLAITVCRRFSSVLGCGCGARESGVVFLGVLMGFGLGGGGL